MSGRCLGFWFKGFAIWLKVLGLVLGGLAQGLGFRVWLSVLGLGFCDLA